MHRQILSLLLLGIVALPAWGVFEAEMPLAQLVKDSHLIAVAKVERLNRDEGKAVLAVERVLIGDEPLTRIPLKILAAGGDGNPQDMAARVEDGSVLVLFLSHLAPTEHQIFAYCNGSWFKLRATGQGEILPGEFLQGEPYLRKTYHGGTDELAQLIAHSGPYPTIDKQAKPGLGPTLIDIAQPPQIVETSNEIKLGPGWTNQPASPPKPGFPWNYVVAGCLALAAVGLLLMITRSAPGAST